MALALHLRRALAAASTSASLLRPGSSAASRSLPLGPLVPPLPRPHLPGAAAGFRSTAAAAARGGDYGGGVDDGKISPDESEASTKLDASEEKTQSGALRGSRELGAPRRPPPPSMLQIVTTIPIRLFFRSPHLVNPKPLLCYRRAPWPFRAFSPSTPLAASPPSASWVGDTGEEHLLRRAAVGRAPLRWRCW